MVAPNDSKLTQAPTPMRYPERINSGSAANALPPMLSSFGWDSRAALTVRSSRYTQNTASSRNTMAAINRLTGPSGTERPMVMAGPNRPPAVPPAPMKPNKRWPCSLVKTSAMNDQNTATANRLNTLTQTKNTRATITVATPSVSSSQNTTRLNTKK